MCNLSEEVESVWSMCDGRSAVVLSAVFEWLRGGELARVGRVCRAWRRAALQPRLWRRLLHTECSADTNNIRALALHYASGWYQDAEDITKAEETELLDWSWRDEYVRAVAGWQYVDSLRPFDSPLDCRGEDEEPRRTSGPTLLHAALAPQGDALAVTAEDASISVFVRTEPTDEWKLSWHVGLVRRGWRTAARVEWAPARAGEGVAGAAAGGRLLVAGPLVLSERWELLVLQLAGGCGAARVLARAAAASGAAGCWASHDAFLSLELRLLAPRRAVTTVWLNSATQEEESEYAGVASPVLRVYNEAQAHISHVIVVEAPSEPDITEPGVFGVHAQYIRTTSAEPCAVAGRVMVAACGRAGGAAGQASALGCWPLLAVTVPRLCASDGGGLAERVARRRRAPRPAAPEPPVPSEEEVRALCSPPAALCPLQARLLGLTAHPNGRCVWAVEAGGRAVCVTLPALTMLRVLSARDAPPSTRPHYVHPALSTQFIASPLGDDGGRVGVWSARSGARCRSPPPARAAVPCVLLPPAPAPRSASEHGVEHSADQLLVLDGDVIQKERNMPANCGLDESCDAGSDRVAARLAASKEWRRREYMREVCKRRPSRPPCVAPYRLPTERECARATDGNKYTIAPAPLAAPAAPTGPAMVSRACGPCREPPPPKCVELVPDNKCQIRGPDVVDPCAHRPKVIVSIDRSKTRDTNASTSKPGACNQNVSTGGITSRIMKSLNLHRGGGGESGAKCASQPSGGTGGKAQYAGDTGWCGKIQPVAVPPRCRPPGQAERLRRRACRDIPCRQQTKPPHTRALHTAVPERTKEVPKDMKSIAAQTKANVEKLKKMLNTRASYKEAAKGRVVDCVAKAAVPASGGLELPVPPGAAAIRVKVSLMDPATSANAPTPSSAPLPCAPSRAAPTSATCAPSNVKASPCAARAAATTCSAPTAASAPIANNSSKCVSRAIPSDEKIEASFIKILQKKIADTCRMSECSGKDPCQNPCQPKPSPCAPPTKPSKPNPPRTPCSPPKAPSKKSDSDKKKKKPTCFKPALSTHVTICN